jgi:hypothetical protein
MSYGRIRCQVIETPADNWLPRGQEWPRDLLPWADPYIARLMARLERQYQWDGEPEADDPLAADDAPFGEDTVDEYALDGGWDDTPLDSVEFSAAFFGDTWQDAAAFAPGWLEGPRRPNFPPVYGGFPLLDDVTDGLEEDPV